MKTINSEFEDYRRIVISKDAGRVQIRECYQAFTAGSISVFTRLMQAPDIEAELYAIHSEVEKWKASTANLH